MTRFDEVYRRSLEQPEEFWAEAARAIDWDVPWTRVLDDSRRPFYRWFTGGRMNTCFNALDRHVERGRSRPTALIYDSPVTETTRLFTHRELRDESRDSQGRWPPGELGAATASSCMMVPESVIAMLACAARRSSFRVFPASRRSSSRAGSQTPNQRW
jgi:propionyl-CoA synthetase